MARPSFSFLSLLLEMLRIRWVKDVGLRMSDKSEHVKDAFISLPILGSEFYFKRTCQDETFNWNQVLKVFSVSDASIVS